MNATETRYMGVRGDWMHAERDGVKRARWVMLCMVWAAGCTDVPNPKCLSESPAPGCPVVDGGVVDSGADGSVACGGACSGATPYCKESTNTCVECLQTEQCTDGTKSVCDTSTNTCVACNDNTQCSHIAGKGICDQGTCVGCTAADESACTQGVCDLTTGSCTTIAENSASVCRACVNDKQCDVAGGYRCVPMNFQGTARPGGYCLLVSSGSNCVEPYSTLLTRGSLSQPNDAKTFCGIAESLTTCEAVLHLINNQGCTSDTDCGATGLNDGLCRTVGALANKCTYACSAVAQCPTGFSCNTYCGGS
jgi:hypothetical protein